MQTSRSAPGVVYKPRVVSIAARWMWGEICDQPMIPRPTTTTAKTIATVVKPGRVGGKFAAGVRIPLG